MTDREIRDAAHLVNLGVVSPYRTASCGTFCVSCGKIIVAGPNPVADACGACFREAAAAGRTKVVRRFSAPLLDEGKEKALAQSFMQAALAELAAEWRPLRTLDASFHAFETLVWCGVAERRIETPAVNGRPAGSHYFYRLSQPDRTINDALGLPETSEPIAACIDFSAIAPAPRFTERLSLMRRHRALAIGPLVHRDSLGRVYLSRSVVERLTGGVA